MSRARQYYSLITAEIVFQAGEDTTLFTVRTNGVLADDLPEITAKLIGKAQQIAQHQFHKRMDGRDNIKVIDVVILALSPLGHMTADEFQDAPKGDRSPRKALDKHLAQDDPFVSI